MRFPRIYAETVLPVSFLKTVESVEDVTKVTVYSNQPEVELFVNGESLGKKTAPDHFFCFDLPNAGDADKKKNRTAEKELPLSAVRYCSLFSSEIPSRQVVTCGEVEIIPFTARKRDISGLQTVCKAFAVGRAGHGHDMRRMTE